MLVLRYLNEKFKTNKIRSYYYYFYLRNKLRKSDLNQTFINNINLLRINLITFQLKCFKP
jgi:hypothetical protein